MLAFNFQDKTDHAIQNRTMVFWGYLPSDLVSVVLFYFNGEKTNTQADFQAKLFIAQGKPKMTLYRSQSLKSKNLFKNETWKNPQNYLKNNTPFEATRTLFWSAWNNCSNNQTLEVFQFLVNQKVFEPTEMSIWILECK